jgi:phosphoribosylamine-glycine ligase
MMEAIEFEGMYHRRDIGYEFAQAGNTYNARL